MQHGYLDPSPPVRRIKAGQPPPHTPAHTHTHTCHLSLGALHEDGRAGGVSETYLPDALRVQPAFREGPHVVHVVHQGQHGVRGQRLRDVHLRAGAGGARGGSSVGVWLVGPGFVRVTGERYGLGACSM